MPQGTIRKVISEKGFGFIEGERGDLFFHHTAVEGTAFEALSEGQSIVITERTAQKYCVHPQHTGLPLHRTLTFLSWTYLTPSWTSASPVSPSRWRWWMWRRR